MKQKNIKDVVGYYYKNKIIKNTQVLAPQDYVEFMLQYQARDMKSQSARVIIDDYLPKCMSAYKAEGFIYEGNVRCSDSPQILQGNGFRWQLHNIQEGDRWAVRYRLPIETKVATGIYKTYGKIREIYRTGRGYMIKYEKNLNIGKPNIQIEKQVIGRNTQAIEIGDKYEVNICIFNQKTAQEITTDVFQMDLVEQFTEGLQPKSVQVTGRGSANFEVKNQSIEGTIERLFAGDALNITYQLEVKGNIASGKKYICETILKSPYAQPDKSRLSHRYKMIEIIVQSVFMATQNIG